MAIKKHLRILTILPMVLLLCSCPGIDPSRKAFIDNVTWADKDGIISVSVQGNKNPERGLGVLTVEGEKKDILVYFVSNLYCAYLYYYDDIISNGPGNDTTEAAIILGFGCPTKCYFDYDYSYIRFTFHENPSYPSSDSCPLDQESTYLYKAPIEEKDLDARYYCQQSFSNDEFSMSFENSTKYERVTHIISGTYGEKEATLSFLEGRLFTIYSGDSLVAKGSYLTYTDKVTLVLDGGELFESGRATVDFKLGY